MLMKAESSSSPLSSLTMANHWPRFLGHPVYRQSLSGSWMLEATAQALLSNLVSTLVLPLTAFGVVRFLSHLCSWRAVSTSLIGWS